DEADEAVVYFSPLAVEHKKLPPITKEMIHSSFGREDLLVFDNSQSLKEHLLSRNWSNTVLVLMSSGNFGGIDLNEFGEKIISSQFV
ncbi:MAG: peptidoglycan synthetase, partial [Bacteroidales bacterium]|nr:peptidoglycan synthetase [Bacteroidales bacterium]